MIKVIRKDAITHPIIVCDACGNRIEDIRLAAAVYPYSQGDDETTGVLHAHKGSCLDQAEEKLGGVASTSWHELEDHLIWLVTGAGMTMRDLAKRSTDLWE